MITGHFGLASAVKAHERWVPLWALMLSSVWLDVIFIPLFAADVETISDAPGTNGGYGDSIIHADYTHSLVGAVLIALVTGLLTTRWWGRRSGVVIAGVVFSHWVLDLVVHRADLALLPGNVGGVRMGLGLWKVEWASIALEATILVVGAFLYWRAANAAEQASGAASARRADLVTGLIVLSGALVLALDLMAA